MMCQEILSPIHEGLAVSSGLDASNVWRCAGHGLTFSCQELTELGVDQWSTCFEGYLLQWMTTKMDSLKASKFNYRPIHTRRNDTIQGDLDRP